MLVIDKDPKTQKILTYHLRQAGFRPLSAYDGYEGRKMFLEQDPCLILLEQHLPKLDGNSLCHEIRTKWKSDMPIIFISAISEKKEIIEGLRLGADDFVTKPFDPEELMARIRTVIRRAGDHCLKISYSGLTLKQRKREVWLEGNKRHLTKTEYRLLYFLMKNPNQVLTRQQLIERLYPLNEKHVYDRTIDVHIKKLREKIEKRPSSPTRIITVRGLGYMFQVDEDF